jgi:hypothetical protein
VVKVKGLNDFFVTFFAGFGTQNACTSFPLSQGNDKRQAICLPNSFNINLVHGESFGIRYPELVSESLFAVIPANTGI